ncbi:MAG: LptF/LptG family permease [Firmicutes bacterium]|nr:LptF/LptG family permease [Bacillota bacterium]
MKILTRYLIKALMGPLLFGFTAFSGMSIGAALINLLRETEQYHLPLWVTLKLLFYLIPPNLLYSAAIAVLLAALLGIGNLSSHSETIAMRAGGLSYMRLTIPILAVGLVVSIGGVLLNEYVIPLSLRTEARLKTEITSGDTSVTLYNYQKVIQERGRMKVIYAGKFDSRTNQLMNVMIQEVSQNKLERTITAQSMNWDGRRWLVKEGKIYEYTKDVFYPIAFQSGKISYPLRLTPQGIVQGVEPPERKSITELSRYITALTDSDVEKRQLSVDLQQKIAIPFASFVFALLGTPLALRPQRRSNAVGFGLCMLFVLIYYIILAFGIQFARNGTLAPFLGAWLANIVLAGYGIYNFIRIKN